jgi:streptogramin lyase
MKLGAIGVLSLIAFAACSSESGSGEDLVGSARASVLLAPTDAKCVVIQVQGTTTVNQQFNVIPQQSVVFDLTGLPVGTDTFSAQAFGVACASVGTATATYVSEPQVAVVAAGTPLNLTFQMVPAAATSGSASVGLNFGPSPHGVVTEFPLNATPGSLVAMAAGPDGNLWSLDANGNKVWRITPAGTLVSFAIPTANSVPNFIAAGPDGNLWFTEGGATPGKIGRLSPSGSFSEFAIPTANGFPQTIAAGPDGNMWFAEEAAKKLARITMSGIITEFAVNNIGGVCSGPDGNLWFTQPSANKIGRMTTGGTVTEFAIPTANSTPVHITTGSDANLWFVEFTGNKVGRITPTGTITEFTVPTAAASPFSITPGPDGNLWFTEQAVNKIGRVTPTGTFIEYPAPGTPGVICAGSDGNMWFGDATTKAAARMIP